MDEKNEIIILARALTGLDKRIRTLEAAEGPRFDIKDTTGDPTASGNYHFVINTFDNNFRVYADGAWRTLVSW